MPVSNDPTLSLLSLLPMFSYYFV